jgi:hypothetical protein
MKIDDLKKLSKAELFKMQEEFKGKLEYIKTHEIEPQRRYETAKCETILKQLKRCLCECLYCTKSKTIIKIDPKSGEEYEYLKEDCGKKVCPYLDFFKNQSQSDEEIEKSLKNLLNNL